MVTKLLDDDLPLKDRAYEEIKQRIQDSTFHAGGFLSERRLSELLGMSKTPIKVALKCLEHEGFVRVSPQQGIVVRELSLNEVADHFELRVILEKFVMGKIVGKLTKSQMADTERNLTDQRKASRKEDVQRMVELDTQFHPILCRVVGNAAVTNYLTQHRARLHRVIFEVMLRVPERLATAVEEHQQIYAAICRGEGATSRRLMNKHLDFGRESLLTSK